MVICCWGYEDCDCGPSHGDCHDCHCMRSSCPECGEILAVLDRQRGHAEPIDVDAILASLDPGLDDVDDPWGGANLVSPTTYGARSADADDAE